MFTYFHCFLPETWQAQVNCGLIDEHAGIRFCQTVTIDEKLKFNVLAGKGGNLWNLQQEMKLPMYIDRLQGGCFFDNYPYDKTLIREYRNLLGDKFFGFQFHEWMNNFRSDIRKLDRGECVDWTAENIRNTIFRLYPMNHLFLESMTAEELCAFGRPATAERFLEFSRELITRRMNATDGLLIPCDSSSLSFPMELKLGVKKFMVEIGAQTPDTRVQFAFARGMAKAHHASFGAYIEPWAGHPANAFCYQRDGKNEWGLHGKDFPYHANGENGGSSRSMQKRMQTYAYLAGAEFMSEEWGMCNTFYDWKTFELSPYGKVKSDFLKFVRKYPNPGKLHTPIGIVISKDLPVLPELDAVDTLYKLPVSGRLAEKLSVARNGIKTLLSSPLPMCGNEEKYLINSALPDVFDILQDDIPDALEQYEYIVNLTGDAALDNRRNCVKVEDVPALLAKILPCRVEGNAHWFLNKSSDGWMLSVFNNDGIQRTLQDGETHLESGEHTVTVILPKNAELTALEGVLPQKQEDGTYRIRLGVGEIFIGKF